MLGCFLSWNFNSSISEALILPRIWISVFLISFMWCLPSTIFVYLMLWQFLKFPSWKLILLYFVDRILIHMNCDNLLPNNWALVLNFFCGWIFFTIVSFSQYIPTVEVKSGKTSIMEALMILVWFLSVFNLILFLCF